MDFLAAKASFLGQRDDSLRDDRRTRAGGAACRRGGFRSGFQLGQPLALAGHRGEVFGRDVFRQARRRGGGLSNSPAAAVCFSSASLSRRSADDDCLGDFAVLALDGQNAFQLGQMPLGVLQPQRDRAAVSDSA